MSEIIEDLLKPSSLPDETSQVHLFQTHISMVFVGDEYVYKIKKPVNFGFLDFSTLEKRHYYCHQEIKLNRRLSQGLYIGVLPVTHDGKTYRIGETEGDVLDYAVKMKRIPENLLMKSLFAEGKLRTEHLEQTAQVGQLRTRVQAFLETIALHL